MQIQSVVLFKPHYTVSTAKKWVKTHGFLPIKTPHQIGSEIRFRILEPKKNKNYISKYVTPNVMLVFQKA